MSQTYLTTQVASPTLATSAVVEISVDCVFQLDLDGHILFCNAAANQVISGLPKNGSGHMHWKDMWHETSQASVQTALKEIRQGRTARFVARPDASVEPCEIWSATVVPTLDPTGKPAGCIATASDYTANYRLKQLENRDHERNRLLAAAADRLLSAVSPDTVVPDIFHLVSDYLEAQVSFHYMMKEGGRTMRLESLFGIPDSALPSLRVLGVGQAFCGTAAKLAQPVIAENIQTSDDPRAALVKAYGVKAYAGFPLLLPNGQVLGTLSFGSTTRNSFSPEDIEFIRTLCHHVAIAKVRAIEIVERAKMVAEEEAQRRSRAILESISDAFCSFDFSWRFTYLNHQAEYLLGLSNEDCLGKGIDTVWPEMIASETWQQFRRAMLGRETQYFETQAGKYQRNFKVTCFPVVDGLAVYLQDITDASDAEKALLTSERRFRSLADAVEELVWMADESGAISIINGALSSTSSQDWSDWIAPEDDHRVHQSWQESIATGKAFREEFRLTDPTGGQRRVIANARRVQPLDEFGATWIGTLNDIQQDPLATTKIDERSEEIQNALAEVETFIHSVSHDLRSPLRSISATSHLLLEDFSAELPDEAARLLRRQLSSAVKVGQLIEHLLRYSRLGKVEIRREILDLSALALSLAEETTAEYQAVSFNIQPNMITTGDGEVLRLALQNLFSNAAKYSPNGGLVTFGRIPGDEGGAYFVSDQGIGFAPSEAENLFEPFKRLVRDDEFPGTGIGLANVRRAIERHNGKIWAEGTPGQGATFWFTLGGEGEPSLR